MQAPSKVSLDLYIRRLDAALKKMATTDAETTRRLQVEIQMLVHMEECREFMDSILKLRENRSVLMDVFGGSCRRFAHIFAIMARAREEFCTEGCKDDLRLRNCFARAEAIRNVLMNRGLDDTFQEAFKIEKEIVSCQWDVAQGAKDKDQLQELLESYPPSESDEEKEDVSRTEDEEEEAVVEKVEATGPVKVPVPLFSSRSREPREFVSTVNPSVVENGFPSQSSTSYLIDAAGASPWDRVRSALANAKLELREAAYQTNQDMPFESEFEEFEDLISKAESWCQTQFRDNDGPLLTVQEGDELLASPDANMKKLTAKKKRGWLSMICGSGNK